MFQSGLPPVFINKCVIFERFHTVMQRLLSGKAENIYYLVLYRESLPTSALGHWPCCVVEAGLWAHVFHLVKGKEHTPPDDKARARWQPTLSGGLSHKSSLRGKEAGKRVCGWTTMCQLQLHPHEPMGTWHWRAANSRHHMVCVLSISSTLTI